MHLLFSLNGTSHPKGRSKYQLITLNKKIRHVELTSLASHPPRFTDTLSKRSPTTMTIAAARLLLVLGLCCPSFSFSSRVRNLGGFSSSSFHRSRIFSPPSTLSSSIIDLRGGDQESPVVTTESKQGIYYNSYQLCDYRLSLPLTSRALMPGRNDASISISIRSGHKA